MIALSTKKPRSKVTSPKYPRRSIWLVPMLMGFRDLFRGMCGMCGSTGANGTYGAILFCSIRGINGSTNGGSAGLHGVPVTQGRRSAALAASSLIFNLQSSLAVTAFSSIPFSSAFSSPPATASASTTSNCHGSDLSDFSSFCPIELHTPCENGGTKEKAEMTGACIRIIPKHHHQHQFQSSMKILENVESNVWSSQLAKSGSGGLFLWYAPENDGNNNQRLDTSNVDLRLGDWITSPFHAPASNNDGNAISKDGTEYTVRWTACARQTRYWMGPAFGGTATSNAPTSSASMPRGSTSSSSNNCLPLDTQFLLVEWGERHKKTQNQQQQRQQKALIEPKLYALVLPLVDGNFRSSLQSGRDSNSSKQNRLKSDSIICHIDSFDEDVHFSSLLKNESTPARDAGNDGDARQSNGSKDPTHQNTKLIRSIYMLVGTDPYELLKQGFRDVAEELQTFETLDRKCLPPMVDEFGWCTWDAFYSNVTPEGVIKGVSSLREAGVPPRTVIIDDGWQDVAPRKQQPLEVVFDDADASFNATSDPHDHQNVTAANPAPFSPSSSIKFLQNRIITPLLTSLLAIASKLISAFYERFVKTAKYNSLPERIWRKLSSTVLKGELYNYFENETDFGRQLNGFSPNEKFRYFGVPTKSDTEADMGSASVDVGNAERGPMSHEADSSNGNGLRNLVSKLKNDLGVHTVLCWHALHGYWRGITPNLAQSLKTDEMEKQSGSLQHTSTSTPSVDTTSSTPLPSSDVFPNHSKHLLRVEPIISWDSVSLFGVGLLTNPLHLRKFYDGLHFPLEEAGVDGVKIDVQSGVAAVGGGVGGGPNLARLYVESMENSVKQRFSKTRRNKAINCINCMSHSTENLYRYKHTSIIRASDDFYPRRPYSHTVHLINVAYNSLFLREICLPDWDMFHSLHPSASLHAAARAIGGCPIYVSDVPGNHDAELLKRLVLKDGSVLRASRGGVPTRDCLFEAVGEDGVSALKIWNWNEFSDGNSDGTGNEYTGSGVVGAFHVQGVMWDFDRHENRIKPEAEPILPIEAVIRPLDIEMFKSNDVVEKPRSFVAYGCQSQKLFVLEDSSSEIRIPLNHREWEIITITPVIQKHGLTWAPIGLADMFNPGGAIKSVGNFQVKKSEDTKEDNTAVIDKEKTQDQAQLVESLEIELTSRGPGRFLAYSNQCPSQINLVDELEASNKNLPFIYDAESGEIKLELPDENEGPHRMIVEWFLPTTGTK